MKSLPFPLVLSLPLLAVLIVLSQGRAFAQTDSNEQPLRPQQARLDNVKANLNNRALSRLSERKRKVPSPAMFLGLAVVSGLLLVRKSAQGKLN
jgi:hypothetical protein